MDQSQVALNILFNWENLTFDDLIRLTVDINIKNIRWLAIHHPDNKTRENLFRLSNVLIGEKTVINMGLYVYDSFKPLVKIGSFCDLAANITLIAESAAVMSELSIIESIRTKYNKKGEIIIENHCWIGSNVIVFPGVTIGHHSIIGAGSIITKDIPAFSIVRGQPGKVVKKIIL